MEPLQATAPHERIEVMDALRGFALLGVFCVNMLTFAQPMELHFLRPLAQHPSPWTFAILLCLAQGKFYSLFSFLFGLGFAVQLERLRGGGEDGPRRYRRRLAVLLGLGLLHGVLVWSGDILFMYGLIGFALSRFVDRSDRVLRIWILALVGLLVGVGLVWGFSALRAAHASPASAVQAATAQVADSEARIRASLLAYSQGPFPVLFRQRLHDLFENYAITFGVSPHILACFLLGLLTARLGFLSPDERHLHALKRVAAWGLGLGLPLNLAYTLALVRGPLGPANPRGVIALSFYVPAAILLCLGYAASLALALRRPAGAWLGALAWPGRMALTCYLAHSAVFTLVFNAYGLGLYGRVGLRPALLMALGLWLALIPLCRAWLSRFRMGPVEWVWRSLTYGNLQRFRA
ncbi:MAG TPA: DUF418 domain-containing protein [Holophagaceae bacterium]|nr:DUF418 domain-containing protein [Holophagaceae bacterium]